MFGALLNNPLNPFIKNFLFTTNTGIVSINCIKALFIEPSLPCIKEGTGKPIIGPIAIYKSGIKKTNDTLNLNLVLLSYWSFSLGLSAVVDFSLSFKLAP